MEQIYFLLQVRNLKKAGPSEYKSEGRCGDRGRESKKKRRRCSEPECTSTSIHKDGCVNRARAEYSSTITDETA